VTVTIPQPRSQEQWIALTGLTLPHTLQKGESVTIKVSLTPLRVATRAGRSLFSSTIPLRRRVSRHVWGTGLPNSRPLSFEPFRPT